MFPGSNGFRAFFSGRIARSGDKDTALSEGGENAQRQSRDATTAKAVQVPTRFFDDNSFKVVAARMSSPLTDSDARSLSRTPRSFWALPKHALLSPNRKQIAFRKFQVWPAIWIFFGSSRVGRLQARPLGVLLQADGRGRRVVDIGTLSWSGLRNLLKIHFGFSRNLQKFVEIRQRIVRQSFARLQFFETNFQRISTNFYRIR